MTLDRVGDTKPAAVDQRINWGTHPHGGAPAASRDFVDKKKGRIRDPPSFGPTEFVPKESESHNRVRSPESHQQFVAP